MNLFEIAKVLSHCAKVLKFRQIWSQCELLTITSRAHIQRTRESFSHQFSLKGLSVFFTPAFKIHGIMGFHFQVKMTLQINGHYPLLLAACLNFPFTASKLQNNFFTGSMLSLNLGSHVRARFIKKLPFVKLN